MTVCVRRMVEADLDGVLALAAGLKEAPHWGREAYAAALDAGAMPPRVALVAEAGGILQGFAVASVVAPQAELESIAVAASAHRRGIGKNLLLALAGELKEFGVAEVLLEVRASNENALGFYRKQGWIESGRRRRYYADPEDDAVLMRVGLA